MGGFRCIESRETSRPCHGFFLIHHFSPMDRFRIDSGKRFGCRNSSHFAKVTFASERTSTSPLASCYIWTGKDVSERKQLLALDPYRSLQFMAGCEPPITDTNDMIMEKLGLYVIGLYRLRSSVRELRFVGMSFHDIL